MSTVEILRRRRRAGICGVEGMWSRARSGRCEAPLAKATKTATRGICGLDFAIGSTTLHKIEILKRQNSYSADLIAGNAVGGAVGFLDTLMARKGCRGLVFQRRSDPGQADGMSLAPVGRRVERLEAAAKDINSSLRVGESAIKVAECHCGPMLRNVASSRKPSAWPACKGSSREFRNPAAHSLHRSRKQSTSTTDKRI
jgi:hypothetical protein